MLDKIIGFIIGFFFSDQKFIVWAFALGWIGCAVAMSNLKPTNKSLEVEIKNKMGLGVSGDEIKEGNENDVKGCDYREDNNFYVNWLEYYDLIKILLVVFLVGFVVSFFLVYTEWGSYSLMVAKEVGVERIIFWMIILVLIYVLLLQTSQDGLYSSLIMFLILISLSYLFMPIEVRQILIIVFAFGLVLVGIIIEKRRQKSEKEEGFLAPPMGPCYQTNGKFGQLFYDKGELYCVGEDGSYQSQKEIDAQMEKKQVDNELVRKMKKGELDRDDKKRLKEESKKASGNPFGYGVCLLDSGLFGVLMPYFGNKCVRFEDAMGYIGGLSDDDKRMMGLLDGKDGKNGKGNGKGKMGDKNKKVDVQSSDCHPREFNFEGECQGRYGNPEVGLKELDSNGCLEGFYKGKCELGYHNGVKLPKGNLTECYPDGSNFDGICRSVYGSKPENRSTNWGYEYILSGRDGGCVDNYSRVMCSQLYQSGKNILGDVSDCVQSWEDNTDVCKKMAFNKCMENVEQFEKELSDEEMNAYCKKMSEKVKSKGQTFNSCIPPFKRAICEFDN